MTIKARGVIVVDYVFKGFSDAGDAENKLKAMVQELIKDDKSVVDYQIDLKERRGPEGSLDIKKMKFRNN